MLTETLRRAFGDQTFTPPEAAAALGIQSPYSTLNRLKQAGVLERVGRGTYRFAPLTALPRASTSSVAEDERTSVLVAMAKAGWESWLATGRLERLTGGVFRWNRRTPVRVTVQRA